MIRDAIRDSGNGERLFAEGVALSLPHVRVAGPAGYREVLSDLARISPPGSDAIAKTSLVVRAVEAARWTVDLACGERRVHGSVPAGEFVEPAFLELLDAAIRPSGVRVARIAFGGVLVVTEDEAQRLERDHSSFARYEHGSLREVSADVLDDRAWERPLSPDGLAMRVADEAGVGVDEARRELMGWVRSVEETFRAGRSLRISGFGGLAARRLDAGMLTVEFSPSQVLKARIDGIPAFAPSSRASRSRKPRDERHEIALLIADVLVEERDAYDAVVVPDLGVFYRTERAGYESRNPRTGEPVQIRARIAPAFDLDPGLYDRLNAG